MATLSTAEKIGLVGGSKAEGKIPRTEEEPVSS